jgi:hypothetical protein
MRPRLATLPYPIDDARPKQDSQPFDLKQETMPFDLCRVKPSDAPDAPGADAQAVQPGNHPRVVERSGGEPEKPEPPSPH